MRLVMSLGAFAFVCVAGCSEGAEPADVSSGDQLVQATPVDPVDILACWVVADTSTTDPFFMRHELRCASQIPTDYPLAFGQFVVEVDTANQKHLSKTFEAGAETLIGGLDNEAFPLRVRTRLSMLTTTLSDRGFGLLRETTFTSLQQHPKATPEVYRTPFSLWPVEIHFTGNVTPYVGIDGYTVPSAPYGVGFNFSETDAAPQVLELTPPSTNTEPATLVLVEPPSKSIEITLVGSEDLVKLTLTGPGNYEFDGTSLKKLDGEADVPQPNDPATPDPVTDLTPDCGGATQAPCGPTSDRSCDAGLRVEVANNGAATCVVCGANGQTYCGTTQNQTCNEGTRLDTRANLSRDYTCITCGDDGQTYCGNSQNRTCNAGTRLDTRANLPSDYKCLACGNAGQTWCGDSDHRTCNEGTRLDTRPNSPSDYKCAPCGGAGQTWCGTSDHRTCNDGLHVDTSPNSPSDYTCKP